MPGSDHVGAPLNLGGWIGNNDSLPGYQTVVTSLPQQQTTFVIFTNTDNEYQGGGPTTALANAMTKGISRIMFTGWANQTHEQEVTH
jgi:hypothetical protein